METDTEVIKCQKNSGSVRHVKNNKYYPLSFTALTEDGQLVRVLYTPSAADKLGRALIAGAVEALALWTPVDKR